MAEESRIVYRTSSTYLEPSRLEEIFDFRDLAFRQYMAEPRDPGNLCHLLQDLAKSDNPIVLIAAGSAAMEAALHEEDSQYSSPPDSFKGRTRLLNDARRLWGDAARLFSPYIKEQKSLELKDGLNFMRIQALHKSAYIPMMKLAAALYTGQFMYPENMTTMQLATYSKLPGVVRNVFSMDVRGGRRSGLLGELACGMVSLIDSPAKHIVLPSSFRQDHDRFYGRRADFIGIPLEYPNCKVPIQVTSNKSEYNTIEDKRIFFHTQYDLRLYRDSPI